MLVSILKGIGVAILVLFLIILALLLIILFVPICYYTEVKFQNKKPLVYLKVKWLLFIKFVLNYNEDGLIMNLKVFFYDFLNKKNKDLTETDMDLSNHEINNVHEILEKSESDSERTFSNEIHDADVKQNNESKEGKFNFYHPSEIYQIVVNKIIDFFDNIDKKLSDMIKVISSDENRELVIFLLKQIKDLLKLIAPKKYKIYLKIGFEDPSLTGQALGAYSVINSILRLNFVMDTDFDNEVLELYAFAKGRLIIFNLLIIAIKVYFNKTLRKIIGRKK